MVSGEILFSLISLGCPKALIDSEVILGIMASEGFVVCDTPSDSDLVIINTCGFVEDAIGESCTAIEESLSLKSEGRVRCVIVYGCMSQRLRGRLFADFPGIDAVVGLSGRDSLPSISAEALGGAPPRLAVGPACISGILRDRPRLRATPRHYSYMRVTEGCSNDCAYCTIPSIRGPLRSRPVGELVEEAEELGRDGVVELNLVAQDTAAYGMERGGESRLAQLVRELCKIGEIEWIRILYAHPAHVGQPVVNLMAESEKVVNYIDLPVQHISRKILDVMGRKTDRDQIYRLIELMRRAVEDVVIRTTLMVGFPGETDKEFEELLAFVRSVEFDRLGVFRYSREEGTTAFHLPDQVPEHVKTERYGILMEAQQEIVFRKNRELVGANLKVIVDCGIERSGFRAVGRTYGDAPEIDNQVYFRDANLIPGSIFDAQVVDACGYDLVASPASQPRIQ
jgi:ribosomal protein S12 methylthiotransferase